MVHRNLVFLLPLIASAMAAPTAPQPDAAMVRDLRLESRAPNTDCGICEKDVEEPVEDWDYGRRSTEEEDWDYGRRSTESVDASPYSRRSPWDYGRHGTEEDDCVNICDRDADEDAEPEGYGIEWEASVNEDAEPSGYGIVRRSAVDPEPEGYGIIRRAPAPSPSPCQVCEQSTDVSASPSGQQRHVLALRQ
ncbi:hypothetical protein K490DRAFT_54087 [Saccharata proteae CBS 121410]|uniref:Uncharacterized protein n=1 Tax=Saccharata proteae CBS 121410 TaxID=1314787 RepID=A0A9P4HXS2_9PEZI|nr:hypothetical protein K490DRAFT_54087 [Saccharata proteae CBS 121410]